MFNENLTLDNIENPEQYLYVVDSKLNDCLCKNNKNYLKNTIFVIHYVDKNDKISVNRIKKLMSITQKMYNYKELKKLNSVNMFDFA